MWKRWFVEVFRMDDKERGDHFESSKLWKLLSLTYFDWLLPSTSINHIFSSNISIQSFPLLSSSSFLIHSLYSLHPSIPSSTPSIHSIHQSLHPLPLFTPSINPFIHSLHPFSSFSSSNAPILPYSCSCNDQIFAILGTF